MHSNPTLPESFTLRRRGFFSLNTVPGLVPRFPKRNIVKDCVLHFQKVFHLNQMITHHRLQFPPVRHEDDPDHAAGIVFREIQRLNKEKARSAE